MKVSLNDLTTRKCSPSLFKPSINQFSGPAYPWGVAGAAARVGSSKHLDPLQQRIGCSAGMPRRDQTEIFYVISPSSFGTASRPSTNRCSTEQFLAVLSWDIRVSCPYQRNCDLSSRRSSASMFRDLRISALLTLSNKVKPLILRKNPIFAA